MAHVLWPVWILWLMFYAESESYGACSMLSLNLMAHVLCSVWILWRMFMASLNIMAHVLCSVWILWRMFYGQSEYHGACFMVEEEDGGGIGSRTTKLGLWGGGYNAKDRGWGLNRKKPVGGKNWIMIFPLYLPECTEHWSWHLIVCSLWILTYIMAFILLLPWTLRLLLFCYPEHYGACSMASLNIIALVLCSVWILWRKFYAQSEPCGECSMLSLNLMAHVLCSVWILWRMFYAQSEPCGACSMLSLNLMAHVLSSVWKLWRMFYGQSEFYGSCSVLSRNLMAHVLCSVWILWRMFYAQSEYYGACLWPVWILWLMFYAQSEFYDACSMVCLNMMARVLWLRRRMEGVLDLGLLSWGCRVGAIMQKTGGGGYNGKNWWGGCNGKDRGVIMRKTGGWGL